MYLFFFYFICQYYLNLNTYLLTIMIYDTLMVTKWIATLKYAKITAK